MTPDRPAEPWLAFLTELNAQLDEPADFHCIGGFVISQYYGLERETADLDVLSVIPRQLAGHVISLAGRGSALHAKHHVCLDHVAVANYPADYEQRLARAFSIWPKVRLWVLEPHDLALTKLERSAERDIRDVMFLAHAGLIQRNSLVDRFEAEMEPYSVGRTPTWNRATLNMWIDACWPK
jgi:hypothetical protein